MNKITIKKVISNKDSEKNIVYCVPVILLRNSKNSVAMQLPHPQGTSAKEFSTLEDAVIAVKQAGFDYILPEGEFISESSIRNLKNFDTKKDNIESLLFDKIALKVNDINIGIAASAIKGLALINNKKAIDIFLDKLGEDNETIRNSAIEALAYYQDEVVDLLLEALIDNNWVKRNSAITCLTKISEQVPLNMEQILVPMINRFDDSNPIVQANAIFSMAKIYTNSLGFIND